MVRGYTIDLSHGVRPAILCLRINPIFLAAVESLIISRPALYPGRIMADDLYTLLSLVGYCLPRLQTVTIDFDDMPLPVSILTAFLKEARGLLDLGLFHVRLSGCPEEFQALEEALQQHMCLEGVRLVHCKRFDDDGFTGPYMEKAGRKRIPRLFCRSRNLRRLWLQDCPDNHIVSVAQAIHEGDTKLKELSIVSSQVGESGVESLSQMLKSNTSLHVLRITLFRGHAIRVAEAADANNTLKKLTCDILVPLTKLSLLTDGPKRI